MKNKPKVVKPGGMSTIIVKSYGSYELLEYKERKQIRRIKRGSPPISHVHEALEQKLREFEFLSTARRQRLADEGRLRRICGL